MPDCHDFKKGQVWMCDCGLELKVMNVCTSCEEDSDSCGCTDDSDERHKHHGCVFMCCGKPLHLKK